MKKIKNKYFINIPKAKIYSILMQMRLIKTKNQIILKKINYFLIIFNKKNCKNTKITNSNKKK